MEQAVFPRRPAPGSLGGPGRSREMLAGRGRGQGHAPHSRRRSKLKFATTRRSRPRQSAEAAAGRGAYPGARPALPGPRLRDTGKEASERRAEAAAGAARRPRNGRGLGGALGRSPCGAAPSGLTWSERGRRGPGRPLAPPQSPLRYSAQDSHGGATWPQPPLPPGGLGRRLRHLRSCLHGRAPRAAAAAAFSPP